MGIHLKPFILIYFVWLIIFYIAGLYDIEKFISPTSLRNCLFKTMVASGIIAILIFYFIPYFKITPKTNLFINTLIAFLIIWTWRKILLRSTIKSSKIKIFFWGKSREIDDFAKFIENRPQLGYKITSDISLVDIIIISEQAKKNPEFVHSLYEMILLGKTISDFDKFYESITGKIPVYLIDKIWFLENLAEIDKKVFEKFKRVADIILAILFFIPLIILYPFIAVAIKINSNGHVFYRQKRVGKNSEVFEIMKFRSMVINAEVNGAQWASENDGRITFIGNILRKTRIDELPQIWNVLKGNLSFIGPRPERPEFVKQLTGQIPYYSMRHLVRPGLSGWAQINFPYGASVEDSMEKMQYDLYYIKNRSFFLEISIILKTITVILSRQGR
ncbi:MAG: sugar transferase [Patescibacteria group bacterium]